MNINYEQQYFIYADSNRPVGEFTVNLFLSWFPAITRPVLKPVGSGLFDDHAIAAFGFPQPNPMTRNFVTISLKLKSLLEKVALPKNNSDFYTDSKLRSYPDGYKLKDLVPTKMLEVLDKSAQE